ncbi:transposase [Azospirillum sp.]|uniref:transposase n=1 Tax=Azospirillum sp. TaxID=34012 RepID=UPI0039C859CF
MILLLKQSHHGSTEFTPAMAESTGVLPGLSPVAGKPVLAAFDGGRLTADTGILLLAAIDRRLGICERLADCIEDPRMPERTQHTLAETLPMPTRAGGLTALFLFCATVRQIHALRYSGSNGVPAWAPRSLN